MSHVNYYILTGIISAITVAVAIMHVQENDLIQVVAKKRFKSVAYWLLAEIMITSTYTVLEGNPDISAGLLYILKAGELCVYPLICLNVIQIFNAKGNKILQIGIKAFAVVNAFTQIVSILSNKFMFYIDYNNIYNRTSYSAVYAVAIFSCVLLLILDIYLYSRSKQNLNRLTLWGFTLIFVIGFCVKLMVRKTNLDLLCSSIAFWVLITYYFNLTLRLDSLTQLLNRRVYDNFVREVNYTTLVFVIDANHFKQINDNYGHESGDETLRVLARCILKSYGDYAYCFRTGGDEFIAILKPHVINQLINSSPDSCSPNDIANELMQRLNRRIENQNAPLLKKFGVSQGYSLYVPKRKKTRPISAVIACADKRMYKDKEKKHAKMSSSNNKK